MVWDIYVRVLLIRPIVKGVYLMSEELEVTDLIMRERLADVSKLSKEDAKLLCWILDGNIKRRGGKVFVVFQPSKIEGLV